MPSIDRTLCLARGVFAALCALALTACGGAAYQVGDLTYDLSSAEKGFADTWMRTAPKEDAEATAKLIEKLAYLSNRGAPGDGMDGPRG